jgi:hypothetical protein
LFGLDTLEFKLRFLFLGPVAVLHGKSRMGLVEVERGRL